MPPTFKNPEEAQKSLTQAFTPEGGSLTPEQQAAIQKAASLVPGAISSEDLAPTASPVIPPQPQQQSNIPDINTILQSIAQPTAEQEQAQQERTGVLSRIEGLLNKQGTEAQRRLELQQQVGLPEQQQQLNEITNQIRQLNAQAFSAIQDQEGRLAPQFSIVGEQAQIQRQLAARQFGLAATAQAIQGNIALAQNFVNQALDAEFKPLESQIQFQKLLLDENKDTFNRAEKKRAEALQVVLSERERLLGEQKEQARFAYDIMLEASRSGASRETIDAIRDAETLDEAISIASSSLGAEFKRKAEQQAFENGIMTAELRIKQNQYALQRRMELLERAKAGDQAAIDELGYDPTDVPLTFDEQSVLESEKIRIEGDIADIQAAIDNKTGMDASSGLVQGLTSYIGQVFDPKGGLFGIPNVAIKRNSFMSTARYVVNNLTLDMVGQLSDRGIKLNPISVEEIKLMGQASDRLVSGGIFKDGTLVGFNIPSEEVEKEMKDILTRYERVLESIEVDSYLTEAEKREIAK